MKSSLNVALLGNKKDLEGLRKIPQEEAHDFAEIFNWQYYEVSAAESDMVLFKIMFKNNNIFSRCLTQFSRLSQN